MRGDTGAALWDKIQLRISRIENIDKKIKELHDQRCLIHCEIEELLKEYDELIERVDTLLGCDADAVKSSGPETCEQN